MVRITDQNTKALYNANDYIGLFTENEDYKMTLNSLFEAFQNTLDNQIPQEIGVNFPYATYDITMLNNMRNMFFTIARTDMKWMQVEQVHEVYDWTLYDTIVEELETRGIRPYFVIDYNNTLAPYNASTELTGIHTQVQQDGYVAFAVAAVNRYKDKGIIWEIWNEPNMSQFWAPSPDVDTYSDLVKTVVPAIRAVDPYALIVAPAIAFVGGFDTFLTACRINGVFDIIDAVSLHPYKDAEPEAGDQEYLYWIAQKQIALSAKPNLQIIAGEFGYSTAWTNCNTDELQRDWLTRKILYNLRAQTSIWPNISAPIQIIYAIRDAGENPAEVEHNFGVRNYDATSKISGSLISYILWTLQNYSFVEDVSTHLYHFSWRAFDTVKTSTTGWRAASQNSWLKIEKESGTFDITKVKITAAAVDDAPKNFTIKDEGENILATFTSEAFTAGQTREFAVVGNAISAIKIDITANGGTTTSSSISELELFNGDTSLITEAKTKDDGSASGDNTGWTASSKNETKNDYHMRFTNGQGGIKYWSWTTGDGHWATFEGYTEYLYGTPILTEVATAVTTSGIQSISGLKTFTDGIILNAAGGAILEGQPETLNIPVVLLNDPVLAGAAEAFFTCPYNFTLTGVRASLAVAQASGNIITIDINKGGVSVLTTKLTIDNTEKTSVSAATPAIIDATKIVFADNDEITIDLDQIGDGSAYGLWIQLIGYRTPS